MPLETYILDIIEGKRKAPGFARLLSLASVGFRSLVTIRNALYDKKLCKSHSVDACVVSIGNIVSGGTGKTPLIQLLAKTLAPSEKVAIVTRGFRSLIEKSGKSKEISQGNGPLVPVAECGDEAYWLASHTSASIWVGKNKLQSAKNAVENGSNILLIDDGMQHRRLQRDVEIILLDGADPWGKGAFLPRGLLRDSPKRLAAADLIVVSNINEGKSWEDLKKQIRRYSASPVVRIERSYHLTDNTLDKVGVFCGIAKPHHFASAVGSLGKTIVDSLFVADHTMPSLSSLQNFAAVCKEKSASVLICTEKDFVKLPKLLKLDLPIVALTMKIEVTDGKDAWEKCIEKIEGKGKTFSKSLRN